MLHEQHGRTTYRLSRNFCVVFLSLFLYKALKVQYIFIIFESFFFPHNFYRNADYDCSRNDKFCKYDGWIPYLKIKMPD